MQDHDYVVVGSSPDAMARLGFRPVGRDFPVFLHPATKEEYALARTERKTAMGYRGFEVHCAPEVTLEEDLRRRDLTINALARSDDGTLIDLFGGVADLRRGILRHVSEAFAEDPVRILRVARFAARFAFEIAPETLALMQAMVAAGEVDALVPERAWQELARGLGEAHPALLLEALRSCGALPRILPEVSSLFGCLLPGGGDESDAGLHLLRVLDYAASRDYPLPVRFACLVRWIGLPGGATGGSGLERLEHLCGRLRVPNDCRDLGRMVIAHAEQAHQALALDAHGLVDLFSATDAWRRPDRFEQFLLACACDFHGRPGFEVRPYPVSPRLLRALEAARAVDSGAIARAGGGGEAIAAAIRAARVAAAGRSLAEALQ